MSTHRRIDAICAAAILLTVVFTVLFMNGAALGITPVASGEEGSGMFTGNDLDAGWDTSSATQIVLSDSGSKIIGNGAYVYNGDVYIVYAGRYVLTGELTDGSVVIDADKNDKIWVCLNGVALHCSDNAALRVEQADKVFLTLADGVENSLSSGGQYEEQAAASGVDGVIYSRDDLTINGGGSLVIEGEYQHGIVCNDNLAVTGGDITIRAVQDGIHANDSVRICSAALSISAGDDGITASNDGETSFIYVESGSISIPACYEGLEAVNVTIAGGTIDIAPTDDGINASGRGNSSTIRITGGEITVINDSGRDADGLDSNGSIYIEGGRVFISVSDSGGNCALDYGSENGGECIVRGGAVIACGGSMMAEGFSADSPQGFLMHSTSAAAGTAIRLETSDGRELLSEVIPCGFTSAVLSAPGLRVGDVCTLTIGGTQEEVTISNASSSGSIGAGMFGGGMRGDRNFGGMGGGRDFPDRQDAQLPERPEGGIPSGNLTEQPELPDFSGDREFPGGIEPPEGADMPGRGDRPGQTGDQGTGGAPAAPGGEQTQGNGMRIPQKEWGQTVPEEGGTPPGLSAQALVLLGVSVLTLLAGLLIAAKYKR